GGALSLEVLGHGLQVPVGAVAADRHAGQLEAEDDLFRERVEALSQPYAELAVSGVAPDWHRVQVLEQAPKVPPGLFGEGRGRQLGAGDPAGDEDAGGLRRAPPERA